MSLLLVAAGVQATGGGGAAPTLYAPTAAVFDGANDWLRNALDAGVVLVDAADTKFFTCTFVIKRGALSGSGSFFPRIAGGQIGTAASPGTTRWAVGFEPSNHATAARQDTLFVELRNASGTLVTYLNSTVKFLADVPYAVAISVDRSISTHVNIIRVLNISTGASDSTTQIITDVAGTTEVIEYTTPLATVGGRYQGDTTQLLNGELTDLWVDITRAPNFTQAAEWEKFFAPTTHAVQWKGNDGSVPYGTQPIIFMSGPIAFWRINHGYGEGFILSGSITASGSPPAGAAISQFALSDVATTVTGTNAVIAAQGSDNWPVAWSSDGNQVTCWGDGTAPDSARSSMGMARISAATYAAFVATPTLTTLAATRSGAASRITYSGDIVNIAAGTAGGGKCYGLQALPGGVLYALVGAQGDADGDAASPQVPEDQMENTTLIKSVNNGANWTHVPAITWDVNGALDNAWVLPAALNMGRANAAAQDEYLYWYAAGARPGYAGQDVATGFAYGSANIMLVRVLASAVETLGNWQVFTGMSGSTPQWSSTFGSWAPVPGDDGNGWTLTSPTSTQTTANNQYPNAFYLREFDEIIIVRNTNGRRNWDVNAQTNLEFWRSTSRKPWGPFALVERMTDWRPYDSDVPGAATASRGMFFFSVAPRWVPQATGTTTKSIATALIYTGRNKGASGTFWDAWNSVPMTLTLTGV